MSPTTEEPRTRLFHVAINDEKIVTIPAHRLCDVNDDGVRLTFKRGT